MTAAIRPALTISKALCPATVQENGRITYTFVVENTGNAPAAAEDALVLTDVFDPILRDLTVTLNGTALTEGTIVKLLKGSVVRAEAGRDGGGYFAVVGFDEKYCFIADGKSRKLDKPKRKNIKHIRIRFGFIGIFLRIRD